jgi:hypothetical protein
MYQGEQFRHLRETAAVGRLYQLEALLPLFERFRTGRG